MTTSGTFDGPMHELGPSEDMSPPTDEHIVIQEANRFLGKKRYPEHNGRMLESLVEYTLAAPGMEMAVALHDALDHGLINPKSKDAKTKTQAFIGDLYEKVGDKDEFIYALGCAISAGRWEEEVGEAWRYAGAEAFDDKTIGERRQITAAIERNDSINIEEAVLKAARPDKLALDTASLRHTMQTRDVEGLILKAVELLDNLDNPPPNNPASTWRDCVETIKCYAPALELFGFNELANDLRGKALEYFYEDPGVVDKAKAQHDLSESHFNFVNDEIESVVTEILRVAGQDITLPELSGRSKLISRIKSEGSIREKLSREKYAKADYVPDGIGYTLIVPNHELVDADLLIDMGKNILSLFNEMSMDEAPDDNSFLAEHPIDRNPVDDRITDPKESGYSAYTISLQRLIMDGDTEIIIPVEIQIVTEAQERLHKYDKASHVMYKAGTAVTDPVKEDLKQIESRAEYLSEKPTNQELNPHTWFDIVNLLPELDTPIHKIYRPVDNDDFKLMVPQELEKFTVATLEGRGGLKGDIFLPPSYLSAEDFTRLTGLIDPSLKEDEQIQAAISLIMEQTLPSRRGGNGQLEGHLLPVALHAGLMAALSSRHWDSENPKRFLSDTITAALLHDVVEDIDKEKQQEMKEIIRLKFGNNIADIVEALTSPGDIKNPHERRTAYAGQLEQNPAALIIKLSDRMQNHTVDLARLATSHPEPEEIEKIKEYVRKTIRYMGPLFDSSKIPSEHRQTYRAVMELAYWFR
jgi:ppGpp synthetase/RelA/SpoT-type nucleotidyltranferase/5'-deoxynucleotidase YfbR-like HD superfamily hydrolase